MVTDKIKEAFILIVEDLAMGEITINYTGRFMKGKKTIGVVLNPDVMLKFLLSFGYHLYEYRELGEMKNLTIENFNFCQDNMGSSIILYLI